MTDIVERLRERREVFWTASSRGRGAELRYGDAGDRLCREAADEIERLRAELAQQKEKRTTPPTVSSVADGQPTCDGNERGDAAPRVAHIVCNEDELDKRGEPVAWLNQDDAENALWEAINNAGRIGNPTDDKLILEHLKKRGIWIGNYTAPPQREEPLSDEQIAASNDPLLTSEPRPGRFALFLAGARFAERAHGIGDPE